MDTSRGDEWATWFTGGKLNLAWNCVHKWAAGELAEEEAAIWHGEDGSRIVADVGRAVRRGLSPGRRARVDRHRSGRRGRDLPADVAAGRNRIARLRASRRSAGADLLRLRSACDRRAAGRREGEGADHGGRLASSRTGRADEADRGRGARIVTDGDAHGRLAPARAGRRPDDDRPRPLLGRARQRRPPGICPRSRSIPSIPTCSRTRRERPASRRERCTSRAGSSSRSHARLRTRRTSSRAIASTSPRTWAGSWDRGPSSAAAPAARRSSTRRARRTFRRTGSGSSSSPSA